MLAIVITIVFVLGGVAVLCIPKIVENVRIPSRLKIRQISLAEMPGVDMDFVSKSDREAETLGFRWNADFVISNLGAENYSRQYMRDDGTYLTVSEVTAAPGHSQKQIDVWTEMTDRSGVRTCNMKLGRLFVPIPGRIDQRFPEIDSVRPLLDRHQSVVRSLQAKGRAAQPIDRRDLETQMNEEHQREMQLQVSQGIFRLDDTEQYYRATTKLAWRGIVNYANPFSDNVGVVRFVLGYGASLAICMLGSFLFVNQSLDGDDLMDFLKSLCSSYLELVTFYVAAGASAGYFFRGKALLWSWLVSIPPLIVYYGQLPWPFLLFAVCGCAANGIERLRMMHDVRRA